MGLILQIPWHQRNTTLHALMEKPHFAVRHWTVEIKLQGLIAVLVTSDAGTFELIARSDARSKIKYLRTMFATYGRPAVHGAYESNSGAVRNHRSG